MTTSFYEFHESFIIRIPAFFTQPQRNVILINLAAIHNFVSTSLMINYRP
jgi:hypothetical protein